MSQFSSFRKAAWDPVLILSQIATLQCFGYSTYSFCMVVSSFLTDISLSPALLFDSTLVRADTVQGWVIATCLVAIGFANILPLVYMVERSRLCIDFSLTFYTIHLVLVWWYQGGLPKTLLWWAVVGVSGCAMAFVGRAACMRRELLPIAIRNFMPDHPSEQREREVDEEMELETRCGQPQPEVLYEADAHIDRDDDDDHVHDNVCNDDGNGNRTNDDDGWSNDNWGDDDEDEESAPSLQGSRPRTDTLKAAESTGASAAGTPLNPDKGDKDR